MKDKNGGRRIRANMKTFMDLLPLDNIPTFDELMDKIHERAERLRGGDRTLEQRDLDLFGPHFSGWDNVHAAVLDDREIALPNEMLPKSKEETLRCCEQLIDRGEDGDLINLVTASWDIDLVRFANRLWQTAAKDRPFFEAVITGRHKSAFFYMRDIRTPLTLTPAAALALIANMGLLWCAHDVQLTAARLRRAARKPMGEFLVGEPKLLGAATPHRIGRRFISLAKKALDYYCTEEELAEGKRPRKTFGKAFEVLMIRRYVEDRGLPPESQKKKLDALVVGIRDHLQKASDPWLDEIRLSKPSGDHTRTKFSQIWWSNLEGLQPLAVSVLRFLQAEALIGDLVEEAYQSIDRKPQSKNDRQFNRLRRSGPPVYGFLPAFAESDLKRGWVERSRMLMTAYRRAIVDDSDLNSRRKASGEDLGNGSDASHDDTYFGPASEFLAAQGERRFGDDHGDHNSPRRTFYLLDVLPDVRLTR